MLIMLALPATATESISSLQMGVCDSHAATAKKIMEHRQAGTAMSTLMKRISGVAVPEGPEKEAARKLVIDAYDSPRFGSDKYQEVAVQDFENDQYLLCVKSIPRKR